MHSSMATRIQASRSASVMPVRVDEAALEGATNIWCVRKDIESAFLSTSGETYAGVATDPCRRTKSWPAATGIRILQAICWPARKGERVRRAALFCVHKSQHWRCLSGDRHV